MFVRNRRRRRRHGRTSEWGRLIWWRHANEKEVWTKSRCTVHTWPFVRPEMTRPELQKWKKYTIAARCERDDCSSCCELMQQRFSTTIITIYFEIDVTLGIPFRYSHIHSVALFFLLLFLFLCHEVSIAFDCVSCSSGLVINIIYIFSCFSSCFARCFQTHRLRANYCKYSMQIVCTRNWRMRRKKVVDFSHLSLALVISWMVIRYVYACFSERNKSRTPNEQANKIHSWKSPFPSANDCFFLLSREFVIRFQVNGVFFVILLRRRQQPAHSCQTHLCVVQNLQMFAFAKTEVFVGARIVIVKRDEYFCIRHDCLIFGDDRHRRYGWCWLWHIRWIIVIVRNDRTVDFVLVRILFLATEAITHDCVVAVLVDLY